MYMDITTSRTELVPTLSRVRPQVAVQTLLDAQLAFIARVQLQLQNYYDAAEPRNPPRSRWLLLRQVMLLSKLRAAGDFPIPASPRHKAHAE